MGEVRQLLALAALAFLMFAPGLTVAILLALGKLEVRKTRAIADAAPNTPTLHEQLNSQFVVVEKPTVVACDCGCAKRDGDHCLRKCGCVGCGIVRAGGG